MSLYSFFLRVYLLRAYAVAHLRRYSLLSFNASTCFSSARLCRCSLISLLVFVLLAYDTLLTLLCKYALLSCTLMSLHAFILHGYITVRLCRYALIYGALMPLRAVVLQVNVFARLCSYTLFSSALLSCALMSLLSCAQGLLRAAVLHACNVVRFYPTRLYRYSLISLHVSVLRALVTRFYPERICRYALLSCTIMSLRAYVVTPFYPTRLCRLS